MSDVRFGIIMLPEDLTTFGDRCRQVEQAGYAMLGVADSQSVFRELYVALTVAALSTERIPFGPQVTNPVSRHLVVTASGMSSVDEVSGGRAVLGIGSGDSALYTMGAPPSRLAGLEDSIETIRTLTTGEAVVREGQVWHVRRARRRIPIYLAAEGPRTLRLAGRVADGVVVGLGLSPEVVKLSLEHLAAGAAEAGRRVEDLDVWFLAKTNLAETREAAIGPIKMALAASANHAFRFTLAGKALPSELHDAVRGLQRGYQSHQHEVIGAANAALTDTFGLTDYLAERFAFAGPADDCLRQVERAAEAGARQFLVTSFVEAPERFIDRWAAEVMARL
ncbi:MAG: LLM class flavin-dependent oxidoreductase [Acidimicrobiales bacterium]